MGKVRGRRMIKEKLEKPNKTMKCSICGISYYNYQKTCHHCKSKKNRRKTSGTF